MEELASTALQTEKGQELVEKKIDMMRENLSSNNLFVIGDGDSITFEQANLAGLSEQLKDARLQLSAAFNTPPHTLFFENQDYDEDGINDFIQERQEFLVKPMYDVMLPILYKSVYGEECPEYEISFKPLENPTLEEIAKARKTNVEALEIVYRMGVFNKKSVMDSLSDIDNNPTDIFRNLDPAYEQFVQTLGVEEGYNTDQIRLAQALNQDGDGFNEAKVRGRNEGGKEQATKKPTPDVPINTNREEG